VLALRDPELERLVCVAVSRNSASEECGVGQTVSDEVEVFSPFDLNEVDIVGKKS
jgi:hypothetical protein